MKKLITILIVGLITLASYGQLLAPKGIKIGTGGSAQYVYNITSPASYVLDKVGSVIYARPGVGTNLTAYSNADLATVFNQVITALPAKGGSIYIRSSVVDSITTSIIDDGHSNVELDFEKGSMLIAKAALNKPVIDLTTVSNWKIIGVDIHGNASKQGNPGVEMGVPGLGATADGIRINAGADVIISDAYIHNVRAFGLWIYGGSICSGIINSIITLTGWNCIQLGSSVADLYLFVINCNLSHNGDTGISAGGSMDRIIGNTIHDMDGITGFNATPERSGIDLEYGKRHLVEGNTFYNLNSGVVSFDDINTNNITGNTFYDWNRDGNYFAAIKLLSDSNLVSNNIFYSIKADSYGINLYGSSHNQLSGNKISCTNTIVLQAASLNNLISNNKMSCIGNSWKINIDDANCTGNKIIENDMSGGNYDINAMGASTTIGSNIWFDGSYGTYKNTGTATSNGLTTGLIAFVNQDVTVTSASANNIMCLPTTNATTVGSKITGKVGSNGFELRVIAAQATTVYINGVTTNVEAAIPASSTFEITCIDATHWILKAWTALGAPITAIVPDAV